MRRIEVIFPSGVVTGATFREAEDALRATQKRPYPSRRAFRRDMKRRAILWGGKRVASGPVQTSRGFLRTLAKAGLCRIEKTNEKGFADV
jgi:hypothetical protein